MCVGVPMRVVSVEGDNAVAEIDGVKREASLMLLDQNVAIADYVIVHAGFVIAKLDQAEAEETLALMREVSQPESVA